MPANTMTKKLEIVKRVRERSYQVNGITYNVTPKYLDEGEQNVKTRFERIIKNNLTHLTDDADGEPSQSVSTSINPIVALPTTEQNVYSIGGTDVTGKTLHRGIYIVGRKKVVWGN